MGMLPALSSCGTGLPWLHPRWERAGIGPDLPSWAKTGPFTQVPCFCKIVECVCVSGDGQFFLPQSECVCVCVCVHARFAHVYAQAFLNK